MEIIDRYVYAVVSKLPGKQREDIDREIRTLIDDMMEKYPDEELELNKAKKVLLELGDPNVLAENFIDRKRYLIGPKNFDKYIFVLKIVLGAVFLGISIAVGIEAIFSNDDNILSTIIGYFATLFSALMQAFSWVTLIFAISEYNGIDLNDAMDKEMPWSLKDLPVIPNKKAMISPIEAIAGIVFSTIFMLVLYFVPQIFAVYIEEANNIYVSIPFFNMDALGGYKNLIIIMFIMAIGKEILKLIYGRWNLKLAISHSILSMVSLIIFLIIFCDPNIWNPTAVITLNKYINLGSVFDWKQLSNGFIIFVIIINIIDIVSAIYKGVNYNSQKQIHI